MASNSTSGFPTDPWRGQTPHGTERLAKGVGWTDWAHHGIATTATITGCDAGAVHRVRFRALNGEAANDWSPPGIGRRNSSLGRWLGLSRSESAWRSRSDDLRAALTGLYPYAGYKVPERFSAWGSGWLRARRLTVRPDGGAYIKTDMGLLMIAGGARSLHLTATHWVDVGPACRHPGLTPTAYDSGWRASTGFHNSVLKSLRCAQSKTRGVAGPNASPSPPCAPDLWRESARTIRPRPRVSKTRGGNCWQASQY